jgi:hypothetical protein
LKEWRDRREAEDLAEKRRLAPGWLDSGVRVLKPDTEVKGGEGQGKVGEAVENIMDDDPQRREKEREEKREGEELDRVFGGLKV